MVDWPSAIQHVRRRPRPAVHTVATPMIEVVVAGLGIAPPRSTPLLLLKERDGERMVPIGIGERRR